MHKHKKFKGHATVLAPPLLLCVCIVVSFCMCPSELLLSFSTLGLCVCVGYLGKKRKIVLDCGRRMPTSPRVAA